MSLFDFWKKKEKENIPSEDNKILLSMPIFKNKGAHNLDKVIEHLQSFWSIQATDITGNDETATFSINNSMIILAYMPVPIPQNKLDNVIPYTYLWHNAADELKDHTSHTIVSVIGDKMTPVERYTILSKLLCSIMSTSDDCIGIYQGNETLLLQKDFYLSAVADLKENRLPIPAWMYIGIRSKDGKYDAYTYGMKGFNKSELEIIGSELNFNNLYTLMLCMTSYIVAHDITFKEGDTYKLSDNVDLVLSYSPGIYVEETTLKMKT